MIDSLVLFAFILERTLTIGSASAEITDLPLTLNVTYTYKYSFPQILAKQLNVYFPQLRINKTSGYIDTSNDEVTPENDYYKR